MLLRSIIAILSSGYLLCAPVQALTFLPGTTIDSDDLFDAEVADGDPAFFGPLLTSVTRSVTELRDGFDGFDVVPDLYDVTATITVDVYAGTTGAVFAYRFGVLDVGGAGENGVAVFTISGFAGFNVTVGWNFAGFPAVPKLSRSADGDTITVNFFDPLIPIFPTETFLFATDAFGFGLDGTGSAAIEIETFGTTVRQFERLPAPAPIPLPATGFLLAGALGMTLLARRKGRHTAQGPRLEMAAH